MGVFELDPAAIGAADVADYDPALDRVIADEMRDLRMRARLRVVKAAAALALVKGDAPAVGMRPALAAAPHQPGKAEADVGRHIGAHAQEFAQVTAPFHVNRATPPQP